MAMKKLSKEKVKEILGELGHRKEIKNAKIHFAVGSGQSPDEGRMGNISSCDDFPDGGAGNVSACDDVVCKVAPDEGVAGNYEACTDEVCGGGAGNVSACDDVVCQDPDADPGTIGNTSACGDWACD